MCVFTSMKKREREKREKERREERDLAHNTGTNLGRATRGERAFFLTALSFCPIYGERDKGEGRWGERDGWKKKPKRVHIPEIRGLSPFSTAVCDSRRLACRSYLFLRIVLSFSSPPRGTLRRSSVIPHRFSRASRGVEMSSPPSRRVPLFVITRSFVKTRFE